MSKPHFWWDYRAEVGGRIQVGIESDHPLLTYDGHYVCVIPRAKGETNDDGAIKRAEQLVAYLNGPSAE